MPNNAQNITISGFRMQGTSFELKNPMTLADAIDRYNLPSEGVTYLVNGTAVPASQLGSTPLSGGDRIEVAREAKGGC